MELLMNILLLLFMRTCMADINREFVRILCAYRRYLNLSITPQCPNTIKCQICTVSSPTIAV